MSDDPQRPLFDLSRTQDDPAQHEAARQLAAWRSRLDRSDRGGRAALRRADGTGACAYIRAFHDLRLRLEPLVRVDADALAVAAVALAAIRVDQPGARLPQALAGQVSPIRLRKLLQAAGPDDVLRLLRRFIGQLKGHANVRDTARWAYALSCDPLRERAARDFAFAFYNALPLADDDADSGDAAPDAA